MTLVFTILLGLGVTLVWSGILSQPYLTTLGTIFAGGVPAKATDNLGPPNNATTKGKKQ